jgi:carboxymethylenebutenolidase
MCYDLDSSPPVPPISGAAVSNEDLVLEGTDGNRFAAFAATSDAASGTGVVVLPDVRGLYRFYEELALRFAERDIASIAFDYFGRTAGAEKRDDDFPYMDHVGRTDPATIQLDVAAAVAWLRDRGARRIYTVGFCFGGRNSWLSTAGDHDLAGAVGFYGSLAARGDWPGPIDRAGELKGPILALQAGADENITAEQNAAFDEALTAAGVDHEIVTYEGAPHSFFDRKQDRYQAASDDAWKRTLEFIERYA